MTRKLASAFRQVTYPANTVLLRTGERHSCVWVVQHGTVEVLWEGPERHSLDSVPRPGGRASDRRVRSFEPLLNLNRPSCPGLSAFPHLTLEVENQVDSHA